ncbi:proline dehydrogenase family protein [Jeotgalibacillus haloalkalitolerans]|uniref:proline dehydrogenase n=1 Tax=Jeotgalibacillus haloalkalitolerans TaxID=3104292 RepID=A0ABU5KQ06_9BACL|nr:proline dehydrogenase family protein [Jeotgalibacillus sp. HH7-29]MDZ5713337.1 proline dehydrogenase family protein [Jeotgalibacillus sp. HH7-29]
MIIASALNQFFTTLAYNQLFIDISRRNGMDLGGSHFVGGEKTGDMVKQVKKLNSNGIGATIDCLGEFVKTEEDTKKYVDNCFKAIHAIRDEKLNAQISLKLFSVGLEVGKETAIRNMDEILKEAKKYNVFVTINMEEYKNCEDIISVFETLKENHENIGIALQANLFRTETDVERLDPFSPAIRFVKGAYIESRDVDINNKSYVDENYKKLVKTQLLKGNYTQVATHDNDMIDFVKQVVKEHDIPKEQFEFQMLQGMREEKQKELAEEGWNMVVYVPFGKDWYTYFMKRLAERPANIGFTLMSMARR